jgi:hypothetical protein
MANEALRAAFQAALDEAGLVPPSGVDGFLAAWLRHATVKKMPRAALTCLVTALDGFIEARAFGGVAGVVSDGLLRLVVPTILLLPGHHVPPEEIVAGLARWIGSGAGHVLVKLEELRDEAAR